MYSGLVMQMKKQLGQIDAWFDKAVAFATEKKFEPTNYLTLRLAPDQFAFLRQVQIVCSTVTGGVSKITGKDAPAIADDQKSVDDLRAALKSVITWLDGLTANDFEGSATRTVTQPRWEGKTMTGHDFFVEHFQPNFFFHLAHTYAILRHNGVPLGKRDYLGKVTMAAPAS